MQGVPGTKIAMQHCLVDNRFLAHAAGLPQLVLLFQATRGVTCVEMRDRRSASGDLHAPVRAHPTLAIYRRFHF